MNQDQLPEFMVFPLGSHSVHLPKPFEFHVTSIVSADFVCTFSFPLLSASSVKMSFALFEPEVVIVPVGVPLASVDRVSCASSEGVVMDQLPVLPSGLKGPVSM